MVEYKIVICGDSAVEVEFKNIVDIQINTQVRILDEEIKARKIKGITETIPAYRSEMIFYDPLQIKYKELCVQIDSLIQGLVFEQTAVSSEIVHIPVYYAPEGSSIEQVAQAENKSVEEIIKIHSSAEHYIYMLGFSPGLPYIASKQETFHILRRETPSVIPYIGSVAVYANQTNITLFKGATGWWSIGKTPILYYDMSKEQPCLFNPGQWVHFYPVTETEFAQIAKDVEQGTYKPEITKK